MPDTNATAAPGHVGITAFTSALTGKAVRVNLDERFHVVSDVRPEPLADAASDWSASVAEWAARLAAMRADREAAGLRVQPWNYKLIRAGFSDELLQMADACFAATDMPSLEAAVAPVIALGSVMSRADARGPDRSRHGVKSRAVELLVLLWKHGLVLFPADAIWRAEPWSGRTFPPVEERWYGPATGLLNVLLQGDTRDTAGSTTRLFLATHGIATAGDIDAQLIAALRPYVAILVGKHYSKWHGKIKTRTPRSTAYKTFDRLLALQREAYAADARALDALPQSYRVVLWPKNEPGRTDPDFAWAAQHGARLTAWREAAAAYIGALKHSGRVANFIGHVNFVLDYVASEPSVPADPMRFLRRDCVPAVDYASWLARKVAKTNTPHHKRAFDMARRFFDYCIDNRRAPTGLPADAFRNPLTMAGMAPRPGSKPGQTSKKPIPLKYIRMMREIIEDRPVDEHGNIVVDPVTGELAAPTYRWARTLNDYIPVRDPQTGDVVREEWCPARAYYFLIRLTLPLRSFQVRLLDSGEGDSMIFRPGAPGADADGWVPNTGRHAPRGPVSAPPNGFIRKIEDASGNAAPVTGLYINTNKTADHASQWETRGYEIPWAPDDVQRLFRELRDWQEQYNPLARPLKRDELSERTVRPSPDVAAKMPLLHPLFRDAADAHHPQEPLTHGRCQLFWLALCDELERRLNAKGLGGAANQRVALIVKKRGRDGRAERAQWTMHSLRVAGLTHFVAYGVPLHILSTFVAGHASSLMTYYYVRLSPHEIAEKLARASAIMRSEAAEQQNYLAYLRDQPLQPLHDLAEMNEALAYLRANGDMGTELVEIGACPVAAALCHEGGPKNAKGHAPVLGGARNCACCRFLVTGWAWRGALAAKHTEVLAKLVEAQTRLRELEQQARALATKYGNSAFDPGAWNDAVLQKAYGAVDAQQARVGELIATEARLELFILRLVLGVGDTQDGPAADALHLVLGGTREDFEYARERTTVTELWERVAEQAVFHPWVDATVPVLRRNQVYDRMLKLNGQPTPFGTMSDREAHAAGNQLSLWLRMTIPDRVTRNAVKEGRTTLAEAGVALDVDAVLSGVANPPFSLASPVRLARAARPKALPAGPSNN